MGAARSRREGDIRRAAGVRRDFNEPSRNKKKTRDNEDWKKKRGSGGA